MTLDQAIDRFLKANLELRAMRDEIAMARADVEAAGQPPQAHLLIDVGVGGIETRPVQPGEFIPTRWARILAARSALRVTEAQYDDAVRTRLDNLCTAFVDAQEARACVEFAGVNLRGSQDLVRQAETLVRSGQIKQADFSELQTRRDLAALARAEAEITLRKTTLDLANLLNLPDPDAEKLRLSDDEAETAAAACEAPTVEDLIRRARAHRPDLRAYRLGLQSAQLEWFKILVEPLNQINIHARPDQLESVGPRQARNEAIWRVSAIVTLPTAIRNRGVLKRATINVSQTRTELAKVERDVIREVRKGRLDYEQYRSTFDRLRREIIPEARKVRDDAFRIFQGGEVSSREYLDAQRDFNERLHQYREVIFRLRRSRMALDTAVGERIIP